jgi:hypothetical protein
MYSLSSKRVIWSYFQLTVIVKNIFTSRHTLFLYLTLKKSKIYRRYLSIDELHNHDFSFFTICLLGPGYKTHFYHDPAFTPNHNLGDIINLEDKGVLALSGERVLYVERDSDYHMQHWPDDFSVTLNVIPKNIPGKTNVQYILNADTFEVNTILAGDL